MSVSTNSQSSSARALSSRACERNAADWSKPTQRRAPRLRIDRSSYQVPKRPTLVPISQISRDLIQRCGGGFEMAAPISLRGDFDGPMLRALALAEKVGSVTRRLLSLVTI